MGTQRSFQSSLVSRILFAISIVFLLFSAAVTYRHISKLSETKKSIVHSQKLHLEYEKLLSFLKDAEIGQRGYIITRDSAHLQNYFEAPSRINQVFANLNELHNSKKSAHAHHMAKLRQLVDKRLAILKHSIELMPREKMVSDTLERELKYGFLVMNEIRNDIGRQIADEKAELDRRESVFQNEMLATPFSSLIIILFSLLIYSLSFWRISSDRKKLNRLNQHFYTSKITEESELRYRQLVQGLPVALYTCDAEGRIILYNDAAVKLWGRAPEIGKELWSGAWKLYDADGDPLSKDDCPMARSIKTGKAVKKTELIIERPNGERSVVIANPKPIRDSDGKLTGAMNMMQDISDQRVAETQMNMLAAIVTSSDDAIISKDLKGTITSWNAAAEKLFGYSAEEMIGEKVIRLIPPDLRDEGTAILDSLKKGKRVDHFETRRLTKTGETIYVSLTISPIKNSRGRVVGASKIARDITAQKMADQLISESEERFRNLADTAPVMIWMAGTNKQFIFFNQGWLEFRGRAISEEMGKGWLKGIHPDDLINYRKVLDNAFAKQRKFRIDYRLQRKDGAYRWISDTGVPRFAADGSFLGYVGGAVDIHEQQNFAIEMEAKVKERTEELANLNAELENSNAELVSFNHVASHDLQEPLRKIQTFISRIMESNTSSFSEKSKDYFNRIQSSANRMQILIEDLLMFSRTNKTDAAFEKIDLNDMLENAKQELGISLDEKQVEIRAEKLPKLRVIPFQFQQLLNNLIGNSIKYSKPDIQTVIEIDSEIVPFADVPFADAQNHKKYLKLVFRDNGIGFEQKYASNIFKLFQRLHTKSEYSGTGIGLTIVKKIVDNHEGFISAESSPGKGATFTVYLPAA